MNDKFRRGLERVENAFASANTDNDALRAENRDLRNWLARCLASLELLIRHRPQSVGEYDDPSLVIAKGRAESVQREMAAWKKRVEAARGKRCP